jgi:hypothetical protein
MGKIFFRNDQMDKMAEFCTALVYNGANFHSESDTHGMWIIIEGA